MKKFIKLVTISLATILLVACGNNEEPATESVAESSVEQVAESDSAPAEESQAESGSEDATGGDESDRAENDEDPTGETVTVTLYDTASGEELKSVEVPYTEDMNVLGALEAQTEIEFNFNEEEGIVDMIDNIENDYDMGYTWTYLLNGSFAELGVVSQDVKAGDHIQWYYGNSEDIPVSDVAADQADAPEEEDEALLEDEGMEEVPEEDVIQ